VGLDERTLTKHHPTTIYDNIYVQACVEADQSRVILPENADDDAKDAVNDRAVSRDAARGDKVLLLPSSSSSSSSLMLL